MVKRLVIMVIRHFLRSGAAHNCIRYGNLLPKAGGFSIVELLATMGIAAILTGFVAANFTALSSDIQNSSNQLAGFLKETRAKAISTTSAYKVEYQGDGTIKTLSAKLCDDLADDFVEDSKLSFEAPSKEVQVQPFSPICISARGLPDSTAMLTVNKRDWSQVNWVEIGLGGAVKIHK